MSGHKLLNVPRVSHSNLHKSEKIFTKLVPLLDTSAHDLQNQKISGSGVKPRASTRLHRLRRSWPPPSLLCKSGHQFRKLKLPLDPACPDLQNLKNSGPNDHPRAATRHQSSGNRQCRFTRLHAPTRISHALHASHVPSSAMTSLMTPSSTNRLDRFGNLTRSEPPAKKNTKKIKRENALTKWTFDLD